MEKFTQRETRELLVHVIANTTDERTLLYAFRLFRSKYRGPLFRPNVSEFGNRHQQGKVDFAMVVAMREARYSVADIVEMLKLSRARIYQHLRAWKAMSPKERESYQQEIDRCNSWCEEEVRLRS